MEPFGDVLQRIPPLLSLSGQTFEKGIEESLEKRFRTIHFARPWPISPTTARITTRT